MLTPRAISIKNALSGQVNGALPSPWVVVGASRDATEDDNGKTLVFSGAYTVTIQPGMSTGFGFAAKPPASGNASIARITGVTLNGGTSTITRALASNILFAVVQDAADSYSVTGS